MKHVIRIAHINIKITNLKIINGHIISILGENKGGEQKVETWESPKQLGRTLSQARLGDPL